jgi:transposase
MRNLAAQGEVIHNDDTVNKVLSLMTKTSQNPQISREIKPKKKARKAISTTEILAKVGKKRILLFFTGHAHAGENLEELLKLRDQSISLPDRRFDMADL